MKMPARYEGPLGNEKYDFIELEITIRSWRDDTGPFQELHADKDVPAAKVLKYAIATRDSIIDTSMLIDERPRLTAVIEYVERMVLIEKAEASLKKAAKLYEKAELNYNVYYRDAINIGSEIITRHK